MCVCVCCDYSMRESNRERGEGGGLGGGDLRGENGHA